MLPAERARCSFKVDSLMAIMGSAKRSQLIKVRPPLTRSHNLATAITFNQPTPLTELAGTI
jgi:hypothetical protein